MAELDDVDPEADVVDDGLDPEELELVEFEPEAEEALAAAWNASNVSFVVGLRANTMPFWQWPVWRQ